MLVANIRKCCGRQAADVEARLAEEAADQRARASEIRREARMAKIKFMNDMDDRTEVRTIYPGIMAGCLLAFDVAVLVLSL